MYEMEKQAMCLKKASLWVMPYSNVVSLCTDLTTVSKLSHLLAGLLANLTCIQAELYEMEKQAMSLKEDPLWVVPYSTIDEDYVELIDDFLSYAGVGCL